MSQITGSAAERVSFRYGKARTESVLNRKKTVWIIAIVAITGALVWAGSLAFFRDGSPTNPQNITFTIIDSTRSISSFSVVPDESRDITCSVVAKNQYEAVVGYKEVTVPADPQTDGYTPAVQEVEVRTVQRAYQGYLETCSFIG